MRTAQGTAAMQQDTAMLRRHMQEEEVLMGQMRADLTRMRGLSPEQWTAHMPEHIAVMDSMFSIMQGHMGEGGAVGQPQMGPGMHMGGHMRGRMMGGQMHGHMMSGEMHQRMMSEMQALHADADFLRHASPAEVRERMPAHLDRFQHMLQMMEQMRMHQPGM
jgi:hypothetical protein